MKTTTMKRPNYYILLDLPFDPPVEDENQIRAALNKKLSEWRRNTNHPRLQQQVKYYISLKQNMEEVMLNDPQARKNEAAAAKNQAQAEQMKEIKEREANLDSAIKILIATGYISDAAVEALSEKFQFSKEEVEKKIPPEARMPSDVQGDQAKQDVEAPALDQTKMNKISDLLKKLEVNPRTGKVATLYDFLNMTEDADEKTLIDLSEKLYRELLRKPPGIASVDYQKDLCGLIKTVFKTNDERKKYDESLKKQRFSHMKLYIDLAAEQGAISAAVFEQLVIQSAEEGLSQHDAENLIQIYCGDMQYRLQLHSGGHSPQDHTKKRNQCGYCGTYNEDQTKCCVSCGNDLEQECLVCQTVSPTNVKHCRNCGTSLSQMIHYKKLLKDGYSALQLNDVEQAGQLFASAQFILDNHDTKAALELVDEKKKRISLRADKVQEELNKKRIYSAEMEWKQLRKMAPHHESLEDFEKEITRSLNELDRIRHRVSQAITPADKIPFYLEALRISADCKWAEDRLKEIPPLSPEGFRADINGKQITLAWKMSEPEGFLEYKIVRRENTPPGYLEDGELLSIAKQSSFTDHTAQPGKKYWYAVFAARGQDKISKPALCGPLFLMREVEELQAVPMAAGMKITWKNDSRMPLEVWKKEGMAPKRPGDGTLVRHDADNEALDRNAVMGRKYGYTIFAKITDEKGEIQFSKGESVEAVMLDAPPVEDLSCSLADSVIELTWTEPPKGTVVLFGSSRSMQIRQGECHTLLSIQEQYDELAADFTEPGRASLTKSDANNLYILPVTVVDGYAVAGNLCVIKTIPDVAGLKSRIAQRGVLLEWQWPEGIEEAVIVYNQSSFPACVNDEGCSKVVYTRDQYNASQGLILDAAPDSDLYVTVFAREEHHGTVYYSKGAHSFSTTKTPPRMSYKLASQGLFSFKKVHLTFKIDQHQMAVPELLIVKKRGSQPLNSKDGTEVFRIKPIILQQAGGGRLPKNNEPHQSEELTFHEDGSITVNLTSHREKGSYIRVFFVNGDDAQKFILEPLGKMELG